MQSFWNQERGVYEISIGREIVAETSVTKTMLRMLTQNAEVLALKDAYKQQERGLKELLAAYPPEQEAE